MFDMPDFVLVCVIAVCIHAIFQLSIINKKEK
jgi:hypothetical protein